MYGGSWTHDGGPCLIWLPCEPNLRTRRIRWLSFAQANSIEGCKRKDVHVVYTRWQNLEKKASYEAGQVGGKHLLSACGGSDLGTNRVGENLCN